MKQERKTEFIIIRVSKVLKNKIMRMCGGRSKLSEYVREVLEKL